MKYIKKLIVLCFLLQSSVVFSGVDEGWDAFERGDYETAIFNLEKALLEDESASVKYLLGLAYYAAPQGVDDDYTKAFQNISAAADEMEDADIFTTLGGLYYHGQGVRQSDRFAAYWFKKAIEITNDMEALWLLAKIYIGGEGGLQNYSTARKLLLIAAEKGDANSEFELGHLYEFGKGVQKNIPKAVEYYKKAAEKGDADAEFRVKLLTNELDKAETSEDFLLGLNYSYGFTVKLNFEKAIEHFIASAEGGDPTALYNAGFLMSHFSPVKRRVEAAQLLLQSAQLGNVYAQTSTSGLFHLGVGVEKDLKKSFYWLLQAANQGDIYATREVGDSYYDGTGVKRDFKKALEWYQKASGMGNGEATTSIASMYENGDVPSNGFDDVLKTYTLAAEQGYPRGQDALATIYYEGVHVPKDYSKALFWFNKAAEQKLPSSQNKLGVLFEHGHGVKKDIEKSIYWYKKAADNDNIEALLNLFTIYAYGEVVKKNWDIAYDYAYRAAMLGSPEGQYYVARMWEEEDIDEAIYWYEESALNDYYKSQMTLGEIYFFGDYGITIDYEKSSYWFREAAYNSERKTFESGELQVIGTGTGFFVSPNHIVTNSHVIDSCDAVAVKNLRYESEVEILDVDQNSDLAILVTGNPISDTLFLRHGSPVRTGEGSIVIGYPFASTLGSGSKLTVGNISALTGFQNNIAHMQLTSPVQPGNSGGPLLDEGGNVIGVVVSRLEKSDEITGDRPAQNVNFAIKVDLLKMFLDFNMISYSERKTTSLLSPNQIFQDSMDGTVQVHCKAY